jgi:diguanylate cyclase (GGDEF)-like protein
MDVVIAYSDGKFVDDEYNKFETELMFPDMWSTETGGNVYYFSPVHYQDRCLGYTVICNSEFPQSPVYHAWVQNVSNSLENIRKLCQMDFLNKELEDLYVYDPLGNIYNRNGFSKFTNKPYLDCVIERKPVLIMFIDMDGLKYINDRFGHKEGDSAIVEICSILKKSCEKDEVCARFGGDEFVVFAPNYTEQDAEKLVEKFVHGMTEYNSCSEKPYNIDASIGCYISCPEPNVSIFALVSIADKRMYEEKKKKRHSKYLRRW